MKTLLVDSGNRSIKWAMLADGELSEHGRVDRAAGQSLQEAWAAVSQPQRVVAGNVAGEYGERAVREIAREYWQLDPVFISSTRACCGLTNCYSDAMQLGVDRWLAMIAAKHLVRGPVIVVDCGTAVTIDLVDEVGLFRGGVIMAGLGLSRAALRSGTAVLEEYDADQITATASSTATAVISGTLIGLAGAIERVVQDQSTMLEVTPTVFLSGGDAEKLLLLLNFNVEMRPDLVLQGLRVCVEAPTSQSRTPPV